MSEISTLPFLRDTNLKAYYRFESGALTTDSSGNAYTLTNTGTVAGGTGVYGGAADLGASNTTKNFIIADALGIDGGACSFSFWMKLNTDISTGYQDFIQQGNNNTKTRYGVYYFYNSGTPLVTFGRLREGILWDQFTTAKTLGTTNWYHMVITYDGSTVRGYIDNASVGSVASTGNGSSATTTAFAIGASTGQTQRVSALFDDVAVFSKALSTDEIAEIYSSRVQNNFLQMF